MRKIITAFFTCAILFSCTKEIDIDLNESNPKFVIEGNVSTALGASKVTIHKTINFDESAPYPTVSAALVTITDNTVNQTYTLSEIAAGLYYNSSLLGAEGHTYTITVNIGTEIFTAVSTMPYRVNLDSLVQENLAGTGTGGGPGGPAGTGNITITPKYADPSAFENYYQFVVSRNGVLQNDIFVRSDIGFNGSTSPLPLRVDAEKNDVVTVDMQGIDKAVYNYFFGLNENINQSTATPANPASNFNNGALGYFKAHTTQTKTIIIQ
ncbi:MAG: DUF4249 family protein [Chitinophagaceae bacterium]|nr:DUF4249 family protein [Chitinophagaceae bacterium]